MVRDKRSEPRRTMRYSAWILAGPDQSHSCRVSDISDSGARINIDDADKLPERFFLMLSERGTVRRSCRVIWREPNQLGVKFEQAAAAPGKKSAPVALRPAVPPLQEAEPEAQTPASAESKEATAASAAKTAGEFVHVD